MDQHRPRSYPNSSEASSGDRLGNLITDREPPTWQALEDAVQGILAECGMVARRQVPITFPRGAAVVDVLATEVVDGIATTTICECKNWKASVPQEVVFAFRTIMLEAGAHRGYIISKSGFQRGAVLAARSTNIELLTFEDFQARYFDKWMLARCWTLERSVGKINTYYEPFGIPGMEKITTESEQEDYYRVWKKYLFVGLSLARFSPYGSVVGRAPPQPKLPLDLSGEVKIDIVVPRDLVAATGYQEFLEILEGYAREGLAALRALNPNTRGKSPSDVERDD